MTLTDSAADRFPPDPASAEPAPVEVPDEDALPDEMPVDEGERDPDIESTAVLPVIEPPVDDTETT